MERRKKFLKFSDFEKAHICGWIKRKPQQVNENKGVVCKQIEPFERPGSGL